MYSMVGDDVGVGKGGNVSSWGQGPSRASGRTDGARPRGAEIPVFTGIDGLGWRDEGVRFPRSQELREWLFANELPDIYRNDKLDLNIGDDNTGA